MQLLLETNLPNHHLLQAFTWMLIHSLWQGLVFTVITGVVLQLTTRATAVVRYNIISGLLLAFVAACIFTFLYELNNRDNQVKFLQQAANANTGQQGFLNFILRCVEYLSGNASLIVLLWFVVFCFKSAQVLTALIYHKHLKDETIPVPEEWAKRLTALCERLGVNKTVQLLQSEVVKIPVVISHLKPVIFIPVGLLTSLPPGEVEAVLLHELAHIRRNDYLINMMQVITESMFFFNPGLLWMSNVLREERENCCDDIAIQHSGSKKLYLHALVSFKEHALPLPGLAPALYTGRNQLLKRVTRIINSRNPTLDVSGKKFFVVSCIMLALLLLAVTNTGKLFQPTKWAVKDNAQVHLVQVNKIEQPGIEGAVRQIADRSVLEDAIVVKTSATPNLKIAGKAQSAKRKTAFKDLVEQKVLNQHDNGNVDYVLHRAAYATYDLQTEQQEAVMSRLQAQKDREQAEKDRKQAEADRLQAQKDREQADRDKKQAILDREQAEKDRQQAEEDRQRANKERLFHQSQKVII